MRAADLVSALISAGATVATAESLTGGLVCAALTEVPGASACVRGGVIAYDVAVKSAILGVDADRLLRRGAVDPDIARQMAAGVREALGADYGVATTGSAGPDPAPGGSETAEVAPGRGYVAVSGPSGVVVRGFEAAGGRSEIRAHAVAAAIDLLGECL